MKELSIEQSEQVSGGLPIAVALPLAYAIRTYGKTALVTAGGIIAGWLSE